MNFSDTSFLKYIISKQNRVYVWLTLAIGIVYFIILRYLYPIPSYYSDSFTWVGAARTGQPITFRPVGYSKLMIFFRYFTKSDIALIAAQYFSNLAVNLLLFFTCTGFFPLRKVYKVLLFILLLVNPFYLFYSNYISSDAFFSCLTVLWFILLIWIMYKPTWLNIALQILLLAALFELRYNAIFFPGVATIALLLAKMDWRKKAVAIAASFLVIGTIVLYTMHQTQKFAGTKTFSAFSGWQLANDALHVLPYNEIDTSKIEDKEVKEVTKYMVTFFDTTKQHFPDTSASAFYMWYFQSPLKLYMQVYPGKNKFYFRTWNALGPIYSKFGKEVILQHPLSYIERFVLPNAKAYFLPPLEIYETYMEGRTIIPPIVQKFYKYKSNKVPQHHPTIYAAVFTPIKVIFTLVNIVFIIAVLYYVVKKKFNQQSIIFNHTLLCFAALYVANFLFVVLLAPSVLRYHIFLLTLLFPMLFYLLQQLTKPLELNKQ